MSEPKTNRKRENTDNPIRLRRIADYGGRFVDYRMGFIGAGVMSIIVFGINFYGTQDWSGATTAALKQGTYTAVFGGIIMRGCEALATRIQKKVVALIAAVLIPATISIALTYGVHCMKGTPRPVESTIPTVVLIIPSTVIWGFMKRNGHDKYNL
jgi:hypothetical protein